MQQNENATNVWGKGEREGEGGKKKGREQPERPIFLTYSFEIFVDSQYQIFSEIYCIACERMCVLKSNQTSPEFIADCTDRILRPAKIPTIGVSSKSLNRCHESNRVISRSPSERERSRIYVVD